ncbi:MAG: cytochrome c biogenesis protein CcsA [Sphingobacteriia bacterium]|nr:cytochrome c biogenesis protein CcsA [Sphingobacteriia bacterium]
MINLTPAFFHNYSKKLASIFAIVSSILFVIGTYIAFYVAPLDYQQEDAVRIMYIHVPSAWLALNIYFAMGTLGITYIIWRNHLNIIIANGLAQIGAIFAFITLITGSLWGKPMWGTYWVWDARLTSMLIMFLFYIGYNLFNYYQSLIHTDYMALAILAIVGAINVPIVKFSVNLWNSLHQPASILRKGGIAIHNDMLIPLFIMFIACICLVITISLIYTEKELLKRKKIKNKIRFIKNLESVK